MKRVLLLALLPALAGCGAKVAGTALPPAPQSPAQAVYEATGAYAGALAAAVAYRQLPACGAVGAPVVCADPAVVAKLRAADTVAEATLHAAQVTVTTGASAGVQAEAVAAAQGAVASLTVLTTTLGVK